MASSHWLADIGLSGRMWVTFWCRFFCNCSHSRLCVCVFIYVLWFSSRQTKKNIHTLQRQKFLTHKPNNCSKPQRENCLCSHRHIRSPATVWGIYSIISTMRQPNTRSHKVKRIQEYNNTDSHRKQDTLMLTHKHNTQVNTIVDHSHFALRK